MLERWRDGLRRRLRRARASARARRASSSRPRAGSTGCSARLAQIDLEPNAGDFRLLDRRALDALLLDARAQPLPARDDRLGRLHADRGRRTSATPRYAGETKYTLRKMLRFALRRDLVVLARAAAGGDGARVHLLGARLPRASRSRSRSAIAGEFVPGVTTVAARRAAARRDPADHGRDHRRVRRAHLRRGQAAAAVRRRRVAGVIDRRRRRRRTSPTSSRPCGSRSSAPASPASSPRTGWPQAGTTCDVYERWPGLGGQAATLDVGDGHAARALLPPPVHHRPPHRRRSTRSSGCGDEIEWLPVERRRSSRDGRVVAVHGAARPAALHAAVAARAACGWASRSLLLQRRAARRRARSSR